MSTKRKASFDHDNNNNNDDNDDDDNGSSQNSAGITTSRRKKANSFDVSLNSESTVTVNDLQNNDENDDIEKRKSSFDLGIAGNLMDEGIGMSSRSRIDSMATIDDQLLFDALGGLSGAGGNQRSRSNTIDTLGGLGLSFRSRSNTLETLGPVNARSRSNSFMNTVGRSRSNSLSGLAGFTLGDLGGTMTSNGNNTNQQQQTYSGSSSGRYRSNSIDDLVIAASALQHTGLLEDVTAAASMISSTANSQGRHRSDSVNSMIGTRPRSTSSPLLSATASLADDMSTNSFLLNNEMQKMVQTAVAACANIDNLSANAQNSGISSSSAAFNVDNSALENTVAALAASTSNVHEINYDEIASMAVPTIEARLPNKSCDTVPSEIRVHRSQTPVRNNFSIQPKVPSTAKRHTPKDLWRSREERNAAESEIAIPLPTADQSSFPIVSATLPRPKSRLPRSMINNDCNEKGQSNQKWDEMFECLKQFVVDKKDEERSKGNNMEHWIWDGNVPTNFKVRYILSYR